jgi:DHA1 family bicyclomycin/chloramphenicol resistance-like MFS transporter
MVEKSFSIANSKIFLIGYIAVLQMFAMFSTDLYAPALPSMTEYFQTSESIVNLTLAVFFMFQLVGMMVFGPVSDRYGRKPVLLVGTLSYIVTSIGCVFVQDIWLLILLRAPQAMSVGAVMSMATALVKDCFSGRVRENVLVLLQAIFVLGPIAAPVIGAQLLQFFSWRACFVFLVILGCLAALLTFFFAESLPVESRSEGSFLGSFKGLATVAKNRDFMLFMLATTCFIALSFLVYITLAPYIYEGMFGLSPLEYSYFFGATAGLSIIGLLVYKFVERKTTIRVLTSCLICGGGVCGLGILLFGHISPWHFFPFATLLQALGMMARPFSVNIMLDLQQSDTGAASSLMNSSFTVIGLLGMMPVLAIGGDNIYSFGILLIIGFVLSLLFWLAMLRTSKMDFSRICTPHK